MGLKNEFETAVVNEPSVFEPLKFYCIFLFLLIWELLSFGILGLILSRFENTVPLKPVLGAGSVASLHNCRLNKTEFAIFVSLMCSLLPEDHHTELILSSLQLGVEPYGGRETSSRTSS